MGQCITVYFHPDDCLEADKKAYGYLRCEIYRSVADPTKTAWERPEGETEETWPVEHTPEAKVDAIAAIHLQDEYNEIKYTHIVMVPELDDEGNPTGKEVPERQPTGETYAKLGKNWIILKEYGQ